MDYINFVPLLPQIDLVSCPHMLEAFAIHFQPLQVLLIIIALGQLGFPNQVQINLFLQFSSFQHKEHLDLFYLLLQVLNVLFDLVDLFPVAFFFHDLHLPTLVFFFLPLLISFTLPSTFLVLLNITTILLLCENLLLDPSFY